MTHARKALLLGLVVALAAAGASAQVDFSKYVAIGDSLTAGYASGGLTKYYQDHSYPLIIARQAGVGASFQQPTVGAPGIGPVLRLDALAPSPKLVPSGTSYGTPLNAQLAGSYNNLGIPGLRANDTLTKTGNIQNLITGQSTSATVMYDLILRDNAHTQLEQAIGAQGTFYTVWVGNNDVLGAVLAGIAMDGVTLTTKDAFQQQYTQILGAIRQNRPNASIVVANIPDVAGIPFATTIKPYIVNPANGSHIPLLGGDGPLSESDFVTLQASALLAQGIGIPAAAGGTGLPLPEGSIDQTGLHAGVILRAAEMAAIRARTSELNQVIATVAGTVNAKLVDINAFFTKVSTQGYMVGGIRLSKSFLTGGLFSYDGVHPQRLGYAVVANEIIKAINAAYGAKVPEVDLRPYLLGETVLTATAAGATVFSSEAAVSLLGNFVPGADTSALMPHVGTLRRHVTHRGSERDSITPRE